MLQMLSKNEEAVHIKADSNIAARGTNKTARFHTMDRGGQASAPGVTINKVNTGDTVYTQ